MPTHLGRWGRGAVSAVDRVYPSGLTRALAPIVAANDSSRSITHRFAARVVATAIRLLPPLRNNSGALAALLASALAVAVAISLVAQARRSAVANASHEVAIALRRQIHRQMYRLGESSLPTDGTGPILNLFTREVNDVADGVSADLSTLPQVPLLFAGLLLFALGISWTASVFLVTIGLLAAIALRVLNRSSEMASVVATREAALQLCLLQEDFGLIRTVRVHGMENIDKQRFDDHLEAYGEAEIRRVVHEPKISPSSALVIAVAVILASGFLAANVVLIGLSPASALLNVVLIGLSPASALIMALSVVATIRPTFDWLAYRRAITQAERSAGGIFAYLERKPELHQAGGAIFMPPIKDQDQLRERDPGKPDGPDLARRVDGRDPRRQKDLDHGLGRRAEACPGLPDPSADRPEGGPGPDRRDRPPRRDLGIGPGAGGHRPANRPGILRHGPRQHRPRRPELRPPPDDRGRQGRPRPPLHRRNCPSATTRRSARSANT